MEGKRVQGGVRAVKALHSDLAGPMSEKLCDLFGRLVCVHECARVCVCVAFVVAFYSPALRFLLWQNCCFYYFIGAHSSRVGVEK